MEPVYTTTIPDVAPLPAYSSYAANMRATDKKISIFQHDHKIAIAYASLLTGTVHGQGANRKEGKRWYRWKTTESVGLIRNKNGIVVPYHARRGPSAEGTWRNTFPRIALDTLSEDNELGEAYRKACWTAFGNINLEGFYPQVSTFNLPRYETIPANLRLAFRAQDVNQFASVAFGKRRLSDRLRGAVVNTDAYMVSLAREMRGLITDAELCTFIEENRFDKDTEQMFEMHSPNVRIPLIHLPKESVKAIAAAPVTLHDTCRIRRISNAFAQRAIPHNKPFYLAKLNRLGPVESWEQMHVAMFGSDAFVPLGYVVDDEDEEC